ncbi:MAG: peptidase M64 [Candidatus Aminicenantes bacterium RBG_13_64_14]|nr:MAG: peptidase M64 [Candidatus Aminicenantes bacterium RBG_13_64_14]
MRRFLTIVVLAALTAGCARAQKGPAFDDWFVDKTMRVDYFHAGSSAEEAITLDQVFDQGYWAGSRTHLVDPFNLGRYLVKVYDAAGGTLIFSKGFDSHFGEYKTSDPALQGVRRTYHESALLPYPRKPVRFTVEAKDRQNTYKALFSQVIDPAATTVIRERLVPGVKVFEIVKSGEPRRKVDIAIVAEGYTAEEEGKLKADLDRFADVFFKLEPYKSHRDKFNLYGVFKPSPESGCDEPSHGSFKATVLGTTFDSLGSERYLLTEDNKSLRDIAAYVPYDALYIMVNHKRYGGGGIYNLYCTFTTDNQWYEYLFLHEFGHSFAGLADEYYTSEVAYNEFYPRGVEPAEPNITALLEPGQLKWKNLASPGVEIPTRWEKADFDAMDNAYQKVRGEINGKIAKLKRDGAAAAEVARVEEESERLSREHADKVDVFLRASKYWGKVGAFEGAGYAAQGLYRSQLDCLMFTKGTKPFCNVCEATVVRTILYYTD